MPGGRWVELVDMSKEEFPGPGNYDDDDDIVADLPLTPTVPQSLARRQAAVMPTETEAAEAGSGSLVEDCMREMALAFPDEETANVTVAEGSGGASENTGKDAVALSEENKALVDSVASVGDVAVKCQNPPRRRNTTVTKKQRMVLHARNVLSRTRSGMQPQIAFCTKHVPQSKKPANAASVSDVGLKGRHVQTVESGTSGGKKHKKCSVGEMYKRRKVSCFECRYCSFSSHDIPTLREHMVQLHKLYVCSFSECLSNWTVKNACRIHETTHAALLECDICQWKCTAKVDMTCHKIKHSSEEPWVCNEMGCGKRFKRKGDLTAHGTTHGEPGAKVFSCMKCAYTSSQKRYVTYHVRKHEKPRVRCEVCGAVFRYFQEKKSI